MRKAPMSPVAWACVPPHSSTDSPNCTTRTRSPYFSEKSATAPAELTARVAKLVEREKELERELEKTRAALRKGGSGDPLASARELAGVKVISTEVPDADPKELRGMVDDLKNRLGSGIVLLATRQEGRVSLAMGVTDDLVARFQAGKLIAEIASVVGGKGGGRADFAQAGGPQADALPQALERFEQLVSTR